MNCSTKCPIRHGQWSTASGCLLDHSRHSAQPMCRPIAVTSTRHLLHSRMYVCVRAYLLTCAYSQTPAYTCQQCPSRTYTSAAQLLAHMRSTHTSDDTVNISQYKCLLCQRLFADRARFDEHCTSEHDGEQQLTVRVEQAGGGGRVAVEQWEQTPTAAPPCKTEDELRPMRRRVCLLVVASLLYSLCFYRNVLHTQKLMMNKEHRK